MGEEDALASAVTSAIYLAEERDYKAADAWEQVAKIEDALAALHPAGTVEGDMARRGAVEARRKAADRRRKP